MTTIKLVLSIVAFEDLHLEQLDVKTGFLHGDLDKDIYMTQSEGFQSAGKEENLVCKLKKSLNGLKQAPRQWYLIFDSFMQRAWSKRCVMNHCFDMAEFNKPKDTKSSIHLVKNLKFCNWAKLVRILISEGSLSLLKILGTKSLAEMFTRIPCIESLLALCLVGATCSVCSAVTQPQVNPDSTIAQFSTGRAVWHEPEQFSSELNNISLRRRKQTISESEKLHREIKELESASKEQDNELNEFKAYVDNTISNQKRILQTLARAIKSTIDDHHHQVRTMHGIENNNNATQNSALVGQQSHKTSVLGESSFAPSCEIQAKDKSAKNTTRNNQSTT
ncbi:retrovirus-related pol polyprotein from transposon TNT 1-94 [Tanacetum coccineum]|uniref:Retrovirus-related pol polyprotein from transposon TNT 1-94 n=1 Tax=Tanacetum coccineum TaxID=301880 RepID=A0ABQ5C871_9ASTR